MTAAAAFGDRPDERIRLETPAEVDVELVCPACGAVESIGAKLATRLVICRGEASRLSLRVRALRIDHSCAQATLSSLAREDGDL
jgi:hypothetical protein